jgi:hypothetical protein
VTGERPETIRTTKNTDGIIMIKCPSCSALLYSRTSGFCPECKASLPQDLRLNDDEKRKREFEGERLRQMAADLQDKSKKKGLIKRFL